MFLCPRSPTPHSCLYLLHSVTPSPSLLSPAHHRPIIAWYPLMIICGFLIHQSGDRDATCHSSSCCLALRFTGVCWLTDWLTDAWLTDYLRLPHWLRMKENLVYMINPQEIGFFKGFMKRRIYRILSFFTFFEYFLWRIKMTDSLHFFYFTPQTEKPRRVRNENAWKFVFIPMCQGNMEQWFEATKGKLIWSFDVCCLSWTTHSHNPFAP